MEQVGRKKKRGVPLHTYSLGNNRPGGMLHAMATAGEKEKLKALLLVFPHDVDLVLYGRTPLLCAVIGGHVTTVRTLLQHGSDLKYSGEGGLTALHWAVIMNFVPGVKLLLNYGANPCEGDELGRTSLHLAAGNSSGHLLRMLLKKAGKPLAGQLAKVEVEDNNKQTPLHISSSGGHVENVKLLLKYSASTSVIDNEGRIPLHRAASCREISAVKCIQILMSEYASSVMWQDYNGWTPLHHAVVNNNIEALRALISGGACPLNIADHNHRTPLHLAAMLGLTDMVKFLLYKGVDWRKTDFNGATPVHYAARKRNMETLDVLLTCLPRLCNAPDSSGMTPLMWAAACSADDVIRMLLDHGADVRVRDLYGSTALHAGIQAGGFDAINVLLLEGADPNSQDSLGHSVLSLACQLGWNHVVNLLQERGAVLDIRDCAGRTPLHWAAFSGHHSIVRHLLNSGVDPDIPDNAGSTPLHDAVSRGQKSCISLLLQYGAQLNKQDFNGLTALHIACFKGSMELVRFLLELGADLDLFTLTKQGWLGALDIAMRCNYRQIATLLYRHGALSIITVRETAASRIQTCFRRYQWRKRVRYGTVGGAGVSEVMVKELPSDTADNICGDVSAQSDDVGTKTNGVISTEEKQIVEMARDTELIRDFTFLETEWDSGVPMKPRNYAMELFLKLLRETSSQSDRSDQRDTLTLSSLEHQSTSDYLAEMAAEQERTGAEMYEELRNNPSTNESTRTVRGRSKIFDVTIVEEDRPAELDIPSSDQNEEEEEDLKDDASFSRRNSSLFGSFKFFRTRNLFSRFSKRKQELYFGNNNSELYSIPDIPTFVPSPSEEDLEAQKFMMRVRFMSKEEQRGTKGVKNESSWKIWSKNRNEGVKVGKVDRKRKTKEDDLLDKVQSYLKCMNALPPRVRHAQNNVRHRCNEALR